MSSVQTFTSLLPKHKKPNCPKNEVYSFGKHPSHVIENLLALEAALIAQST